MLCLKGTDRQNEDKAPPILLPRVARTAVRQRLHPGPAAGHFGREETLEVRAATFAARWLLMWGSAAQLQSAPAPARDGARNLPYERSREAGQAKRSLRRSPAPSSMRKSFFVIPAIVGNFSRWVDLTAG